MRSTRSRVMAALTAPVLALTLAGCADDADTSNDTDKDTSSDTSDAAEEEPADEGLSPEELVKAMTDREPESARFEMVIESDTEDENMVMSGAMVPDGEQVAMTMSMESTEGTFEIIMVDQTMYMGMGDGTYFKSEFDESMMGDVDPTSVTGEFGKFADDAVYEGTEELDGETVQHYSTLITGKEAEEFGGDAEFDFYLDGENRLTYLTIVGNGTEVTMDFFDFGATDIEIVAPPKEAVISGF